MIQAKTWDKVVATTIDESIVQKLPIRIDSFLLSPISGTNKGLGHNCTRSPTTLQSMMTLNKDAGVACAPLDAATFAGIVPACTTSMSLATRDYLGLPAAPYGAIYMPNPNDCCTLESGPACLGSGIPLGADKKYASPYAAVVQRFVEDSLALGSAPLRAAADAAARELVALGVARGKALEYRRVRKQVGRRSYDSQAKRRRRAASAPEESAAAPRGAEAAPERRVRLAPRPGDFKRWRLSGHFA